MGAGDRAGAPPGTRLRATSERARGVAPAASRCETSRHIVRIGRRPMKTTANGISVNYTLEGPANAPVVTMSHSLATDLSMWDPTVPALTGRFRVLRYETRGHGKTEAPRGAYGLDQLADDALALLRELGLQKANWVGPLLGGMGG